MQKVVRVIILDANRYIPFLHAHSPIDKPMWIPQYQYEQLKILGFNIKEVNELPKEKIDIVPPKVDDPVVEQVEDKKIEDEQKNNKEEEIVESPVVEETTSDIPANIEPEEEIVEEETEGSYYTVEDIEALKTIQEAKDILDQMEISYEGKTKLKDLKDLIIANL